MIDTVSLDYFVHVPVDVLDSKNESWAYSRKPNNHGGWVIVYTKIVALANGSTIRYDYFPYAKKGNPILRITFSLPKVVLGNNYQMVFDIKGTIESANNSLPQVHGIPQLALWEGKLVRLDVCYNHQLGHLVPFYVRALQSLEYDRRRTLPYSSEGVSYSNASISTYLYNKAKELSEKKHPKAAEQAYGILRQESSYRKAYIKKLTGKQHPTLRDITRDLLITALEKDLDELGLLGNSIGTVDTTYGQLLQSYDEIYATFLLGLLVRMKQSPSKDILIEASTKSKSTMVRRISDIHKANVPLTLTSSEQPLPPLKIDPKMISCEKE